MDRLRPLLACAVAACALTLLSVAGASAARQQHSTKRHTHQHKRQHRKHHRRCTKHHRHRAKHQGRRAKRDRHHSKRHRHHGKRSCATPHKKKATPPAPPPPNRLYDPRSPFNTPAPASGGGSYSQPLAQSSTWISTLASGGAWTNDPDQYSKPIYRLDLSTSPVRTFESGGSSLHVYGNGDQSPATSTCTTCSLHIPDSAAPSSGSDGHVVLLDPVHGIEEGFWQFDRGSDGTISFANGYQENTGPGNMGTFADGHAGEGAGIAYLAGTVTKEDVASGAINHALAAAVTSPGSAYVWPASKSDGGGGSSSPPEGTRLLLDPSFNEASLSDPIARMMAHALKVYGVYIVDGSGSNKFYMEDRSTAGWPSSFTRTATSGIPWSAFRAVAPPAKP
jgi:hypothetical protein